MLSIFTIPKAFDGHNAVIQRNAIKSWSQLKPACEIILFGNDAGISDIASELNCIHIPDIEVNEWGTPLLNNVFSTAQQIAKNDMLMYVNADIIFVQDLIEVIPKVNFSMFLLCGRRYDLDIDYEITFHNPNWMNILSEKLRNNGKLHGPSGLDYFLFLRDSVVMRPFAVGRPGWDTWLLYDMRRKKIPILDATEIITAIHQNHDYTHSKFGEKTRVGGPEFQQNIKIAGGLSNMITLREADWLLTKSGLKRPILLRRILSILSQWYAWRAFLAVKRKVFT